MIILFIGIVGFVFECINAFEYLTGTRLYISDPGKGIASALFVLCIMRCKFYLFIRIEICGLVRELFGPNWSNVSFLSGLKLGPTHWTPSCESLIFTFSTFAFVELGDLAKEKFQNDPRADFLPPKNKTDGFQIFQQSESF